MSCGVSVIKGSPHSIQNLLSEATDTPHFLHVSDFSELVEAYTREFNRVTFLLVKREDVSPRLKNEALDFPEDARYCIVVAEVGEDGNIGSIQDMRFCRELGIELRALFQKNNNVILCKK